MWYETAENRKMIDSMFSKGFPLKEIEVTKISIEGRDIIISFNTKEIPESYPHKWKKNSFNCIHVTIRICEISKAEYSGNGTDWTPDFKIKQSTNKKSVSIITNSFSFRSEFNYLSIVSVTAYDDTRWE